MEGGAVEARWRRHAGEDYGAFRTAFLVRTERAAGRYPSAQVCGCQLRVVPHRDGSIVGVSECGTLGCDNVPLTAGEVRLWALSRAKLTQAVARAFGCEAGAAGAASVGGVWQVGTFGGELPVMLTLQRDRGGFALAVSQLVATLKERFILLAPTDRHMDAGLHGLLNGAKAGFFSLDANLELLESGRLQAVRCGGELFSRYVPAKAEAVGQSDSARVWLLFSKLLGMGTKLKASPAQVFDLMVFQQRTKSETAAACKCAASLITKRVDLIEAHFHLSMEQLSAFASDLKERQRTVKGDRYVKKKQGAVRDEAESDDEEEDGAPKEEYRYEEGGSDD
jgi:hypothetical protein